MVKKGTTSIDTIYKGTTAIDSIYKGTSLVYEAWQILTAQGVPPLALPNCKASKLLNYQIYGNAQQDGTPSVTNPVEVKGVGDAIIPKIYQRVEYIESTGTQYIDTGLKLNQNSRVKIKYQYKSDATATRVFGDAHSYSNGWVLTTSNGTINSKIQTLYGDAWHPVGADAESIIPSTNIIEFERNGIYQYVNNELYYTNTSESFETTDNATIFGAYYYGSFLKSEARVYEVTIWRNGTDLDRHLIPCYRKSDNVIGMYDIVTNTFFTNAGTETFVKGNDVGNYKIPIKVRGKNVLGFNSYTLTSSTNIKTYDATTDVHKLINTTSGSVAPSVLIPTSIFNDYCIDNHYPAGTYIFSIRYTSSTTAKNPYLSIKLDDTTTSRIDINTATTIAQGFTISGLYISSTTIPKNTEIDYQIMLEKVESTSATASAYEKYQTPITTDIYLNEPLYKIGNNVDYLDFESKKIYRNVGKLIITGYESNWELLSQYSGFARFRVSTSALTPTNYTISPQRNNYFTSGSPGPSNSDEGASIYYSSSLGGTIYRCRNSSEFTTEAKIRNFYRNAYDSNNPVIQFYQSRNTVEESVVLPDITILKGTTIIEINTEVQASDMYVKYKSK